MLSVADHRDARAFSLFISLLNPTQPMKNSLPLSAVRVVLLLAVVGCLSLFGSTSATAQTFAKGADTGWLQQMEANGYKFYND